MMACKDILLSLLAAVRIPATIPRALVLDQSMPSLLMPSLLCAGDVSTSRTARPPTPPRRGSTTGFGVSPLTCRGEPAVCILTLAYIKICQCRGEITGTPTMTPLSTDVCERRVLTEAERVGLLFVVLSSVASILSVVVIFASFIHRLLRNLKTPLHLRKPIIKTHLDVYVLFLLLADTTRCLWGVLALSSVLRASVTCGRICDAQGALVMLGDPMASMLTLAIAVHTFLVIAFRWTPSPSFRIPIVAVALMWSFQLTFLVALLASHDRTKALFAPLPYWCWLSSHYAQMRLPSDYFWHWFTVAASILLYVPLFFVIRGNLEFGHDYVPRVRFRRSTLPGENFVSSHFSVASQSRKMLMYPVAYVVLLMPFTVIRWAGNFTLRAGQNVHFFFFCVSLYFLNGLANVLLLVFTRPSILGFSRETQRSTSENLPSAGIVSTSIFASVQGEGDVDSHHP